MPLAGELTASLIYRVADRYGLPAAGVLRLWTCRNSPARNDGGGVRADAEIVLNEAGRAVLAGLCGVEPAVLARALLGYRAGYSGAQRFRFDRIFHGRRLLTRVPTIDRLERCVTGADRPAQLCARGGHRGDGLPVGVPPQLDRQAQQAAAQGSRGRRSGRRTHAC